MQTKEMGPEELHGRDSGIWGSTDDPKGYASDLLVIKSQLKGDTFSNWFIDRGMSAVFACIYLFKKRSSQSSKEIMFKQSSLLKITHLTTCGVAAIPPILVVVVLSYISSFRLKLGLLAVFNFILALCLSGFADASRAEVFGVMAA
jgi:hypothetical protein